MKTFRIIFMGTPPFAVPALKALYDNGYNVTTVVTQPDRPCGRRMRRRPCFVKSRAAEAGLRVLDPEKVGAEASVREIEELEPERAAELIMAARAHWFEEEAQA